MNEKIIELLSKKDLSEDEKEFLSDSFEKEPDLKKYKEILNLLGDMKNKFHLPSDLISEYVLYKKNLPIEDKSLINFVPHIEKHLSECSKCKSEFDLFNEEFSDIDNYVSKTLAEEKRNDNQTAIRNSTKIFNLFTTKNFYAVAAVLAILTFSIFTSSKLFIPSYQNISELSDFNFSTSRGRVTPDFKKGLEALNNNNYADAIAKLKNDISNNKNDKTIFYTNYLLGIIYLKKSESNILGLFPSYNKTDLDSAISYFNKTILLNSSEAFNNISYDAYFYIGKGYLLQGDATNAKKYFEIVVNKKGKFIKEAKNLIQEIDKKL